jgi:hypothetical protein
MLSGLKDTDREILKWADDRQLLEICSIDRKTWNEVCDDAFLKRRLSKYLGIDKYKKENESWKRFFLSVVRYVALMKEQFEFDYTDGDFREQYRLLKKYTNNMTGLLEKATRKGIFSLVTYSVNRGGNIHLGNDALLRIAALNGYFDLVKYFVEKGLDIHTNNETALKYASENGYLNIVKYLIEQGADIHAKDERALKMASMYGSFEIVKYLVEKGANVHAAGDAALKYANQNEHAEVVKYLESL